MTPPRTSERLWLPLSVAALGALVSGCTVALERAHRQCDTSADCQHLAPNAVCTSDGLCESLSASAAAAGCADDRDCAGAWSICYRSSCHQLDQAPCVGIDGRASSDSSERLPFALLVPDEEMERVVDASAPTLGVARTVLEAFAVAREESPMLPELVGVACPETNPAALQLLADAGVRLVIGSVQGDALLAASDALQQQAVLFAATADEPNLLETAEPLASDVVSCKPNSRDSRLAQLAAVAFVRGQLNEAGRLAPDSPTVLARSQDEGRLGYALEASELEQVGYDASMDGQGLVRALAKQERAAGLLVAASGLEDWSYNLKAVEGARQVARLKPPYYLLRDKQAGALDTVAIGAEGLSQRTAWLDAARSDTVLANQQSFARDYAATTGVGAEPNLAYLHDCLYVAVYAALAAELRFGVSVRELSAKAVLLGLDALVGGKEELNAGAGGIGRALELLRSSQGLQASLDLTGGSGDLDFEPSLDALEVIPSKTGTYVRPSAGDLELYCVDKRLSQFCGTNLRFPTTGEPALGVSQCDCFPLQ
jgi:hypothetical protein